MHSPRQTLKDTTFLIYIRIDSEDRLLNLELVLKHISFYFKTSIYLLEVDTAPKTPKELINKYEVQYEFLKDLNEIFHTTKYRNYLVKKCNSKIFFICDTDVIVSPVAILNCRDYLQSSSNKKKVVYPFNGDFFNVSSEYRDMYSEIGDYDFLVKNKEHHLLWFKYSMGGIFGGFTEVFKRQPIDNENIFGWGPDDKERYYRFKKKGFEIMRAGEPLYHLHHERLINSVPVNTKLKDENQQEYLKIFLSDIRKKL